MESDVRIPMEVAFLKMREHFRESLCDAYLAYYENPSSGKDIVESYVNRLLHKVLAESMLEVAIR